MADEYNELCPTCGGLPVDVGELAAMRAALKEALDLAEAHIFAPPGTISAAAAPPHFAAAQPMTLDGPLQLNVDPLAAVACAPPMQFGTTMTKVTVDSSKPYRDKARIAALRKEFGL